MIAPSKRRRSKNRPFLPALIILIGFAISWFLGWQFHRSEKNLATEEFTRRALSRQALITQSMHSYEECLYTLRILFDGSDDVSASEFATAAKDIIKRHNSIEAIEWVPLVGDENRAALEAELAARHPGASFTEISPEGRWERAARRDTYLPIFYTEPFADNKSALGFDQQVGPSMASLRLAGETGNLVMRNKVRLFKDTDPTSPQYGAIIVCPVYLPGEHTDDPPDIKRIRGYIQIIFRLSTMLEQTWKDYPTSALDVLVMDISTHAELPDPFLYSRRSVTNKNTRPLHTLADFVPGPVHQAEIMIGGRTWRFHYAPTAGWMDSRYSYSPWFVAAGGVISSMLLAGLVHAGARRSGWVEQQVNERTAELRHTQGLLETDIAKRQAAEAELRESRRQLDNILRQMPGMAYRFDNRSPHHATFISRGSIEIIGYTPQELMSGSVPYDDLIALEDRAEHTRAVNDALSRQTSYESEYRLRHKAGGIKWVLDRGQGIYTNEGELLFIEGLAIDITRRKEAETEKAILDRKLLESQKLESLGVLAGGIAHDFNNLLTGILGNAGILRLDLPRQSEMQLHLEQIEIGAQRAAELCQQMLAYAGKGKFLVQRTRLETLVRNTTSLLEHSISKRARLGFTFHPGVPEVEVDATQIRQIIMNLVVNASDALGDNDGAITVETCVVSRHDPQIARALLPPPPGDTDFACLRITDTGVGMSPETVARIFDPFFTTKFAGRGLGLAAVLGIVRSHHGSLLVNSSPGAGSAFSLLLPAASIQPPVKDQSLTPFEKRAHPLAGTVLLIDDEAGVRSVAQQMFASFGLNTLTACDGLDGLEVFKKHQDKIALVLLDLTMPRMSGEETLRHLRALAPLLPVIVMSGYNASSIPELVTDEHVRFLQKPFTLAGLRKQINQLLG